MSENDEENDGKKKKSVNVTVEVDPTPLRQMARKVAQLEQELEEERSKREDYETKLKLIAEKKFA
jgi:phage major head subunit gpT-like protein